MEIEVYADVDPEENVFELFETPNETSLEDEAYREELLVFLKLAFSRLNKRDQEVILYRFGFYGDIPPQREVALKVGFKSYSGVDFTERSALKVLWRYFKRIGVEL